MVVAPLSNTIIREIAMDFTEPYFQEYTVILVRLPDPEAAKWNLYISPFQWTVWLLIAASVPCAGALIWMVTSASPFYSAKGITNGLQKIDIAILYTVGSIFSQGKYIYEL